MKILLLISRDIHCLKSLNLLKDVLDSNEIALTFSDSVGKAKEKTPKLELLNHFERNLLQEKSQLLESQNKIAKFLTFSQLITKYKIRNLEIEKINSEESIEKAKNFAPELIISIRYGQILHSEIIQIPKLGVINLHSGIMYKYRGIMSSFWAILNAEEEIGTTLHKIENKEIDKGEIINISRQKVDYNRSFIFNVFSLYDFGCEMIRDFIDNKKPEKFRIEDSKNYYSLPENKDIEEFEKKLPLISRKDIAAIYENLN